MSFRDLNSGGGASISYTGTAGRGIDLLATVSGGVLTALSGRRNVYDITDPAYGAVDGGADAGAAVTAAYSAIIASGVHGGALFFPPGTWNMTTGVNSTAAGTQQPRVICFGCGSSSEIVINRNGLFWFNSGNLDALVWRDLIFRSPFPQPASEQCSFMINVSSCRHVIFWNVGFYGVWASLALIYTVSGAGIILYECDFIGCSGTTATGAVVYSTIPVQLDVMRCFFNDVGGFNGNTYTISSHGPWIIIDQPSTNYSSTGEHTMCVRDCGFDEGAPAIVMKGGARFRRVLIEDSNFLFGAAYGSNCVIKQCDRVDVHRCLVDSEVAATWLDFQDCTSVHLEHCEKIDRAGGPFAVTISFDSSCVAAQIDETAVGRGAISNTFDFSMTTSTVVKGRTNGINWRGRLSAGTIAINTTVKADATVGRVAQHTTADSGNICTGVALDATTGANQFTRIVELCGEDVTVLNDGAGAIAIGNLIATSGATNGQVKQAPGGAPIVATARQAAAAPAGTAFTAQLSRGTA